ncbi:MAG: T9SS type A sorting domain-containing protein [Saprospiraceae bacterium]|nr:T9SS type A sorting domain-containing protein [Saprospiraceae bacterium]
MKPHHYLPHVLMILLSGVLKAQDCEPATAITTLEVNNVRSGLSTSGTLWDLPREMGYVVPKDKVYDGSDLGLLYAGIWMAGFSPDGELKLAAKKYGTFQEKVDYWPGPIVNGTVNNQSCSNWDRFFSVSKDEIQRHKDLLIQYDLLNEPYPVHLIPAAIKAWPGNGNPYFETENGFLLEGGSFTLFYDKNNNGIYEPTLGDYPAIQTQLDQWMIPDEMVYWVFNDIGGIHRESNGKKLGVEVHALAYGFSQPGHLENSQFFKYKVINKSGQDLNDFRFGLWVDSELSCRGNSFAGCDTARSLSFYYTPDVEGINCNNPGVDNDTFPMLGVDFLGVKVKDGDYTFRPMEVFSYYNNSSNPIFSGSYPPQTAMEHFVHLDGIHPGLLPPGYQGTNTKFAFPSPPACFNTDSCWSMCLYPSYYYDASTIQSTGTSHLGNLDYMEVDFVSLYTTDITFPCPNTSELLAISDEIQEVYDTGFQPFLSNQKGPLVPGNITVSPNPISIENMQLNIKGLKRFSDLKIYDVSGRVLYEVASIPSSEFYIYPSTVFPSKGLYWIKISAPDGSVFTTKLAIQ